MISRERAVEVAMLVANLRADLLENAGVDMLFQRHRYTPETCTLLQVKEDKESCLPCERHNEVGVGDFDLGSRTMSEVCWTGERTR